MRIALHLLALSILGVWTNFCFYASIKTVDDPGNISTVFMWVGIVQMIIVSVSCILLIKDMITLLKAEMKK